MTYTSQLEAQLRLVRERISQLGTPGRVITSQNIGSDKEQLAILGELQVHLLGYLAVCECVLSLLPENPAKPPGQTCPMCGSRLMIHGGPDESDRKRWAVCPEHGQIGQEWEG